MNGIVDSPRAIRSRKRELRTDDTKTIEAKMGKASSQSTLRIKDIRIDDGLSLSEWLEETKRIRLEAFNKKRASEPLTEIEKRNVRELGDRDFYYTPNGFTVHVPLPFAEDKLDVRKGEIDEERQELEEKKAMLRQIKKTIECQSHLLGFRSAVTKQEERRLLNSADLISRAQEEIESLRIEMAALEKLIGEYCSRIERAEALLADDQEEADKERSFNNSRNECYDDYSYGTY